ncbi:MAG: hypothetical protein IPP94_03420 [Ignavibacteria bacterium]|nr:hypothetical protein [Ignavibacteria bacterium]
MARFLSRANSALLVLALGCTLGACSHSSPRLTDEVRASVRDTQVWNDLMPGSAPNCHAVMQVELRNTTDREIVLLGAEGLVTNVATGARLRRFAAVMLYQELDTKEIRLAPGTDIALTVRTPMGVPAFDQALHPRVRMTVEFRTSDGSVLTLQSRPVTPFVTQ